MDSSIIKVGSAGSNTGKSWDENGHNQIVQIFISHDDYVINSIQFRYVENGNTVLSDRHGNSDGSKFDVDVVKLNYPMEYITWISGRSDNNIRSITFGTNCGEYGPFGKFYEYAKDFKFQVGEGCQLWGFHGTTDGYGDVKSIGIYLKPNKILVKPSTKMED